jgi:hypothetical protein
MPNTSHRNVSPEDILEVIRVDNDGTVQLLDPQLKNEPKSFGLAFWCRPNLALGIGQRVQGILEFSPWDAVGRGRLPGFTVNGVLPVQQDGVEAP